MAEKEKRKQPTGGGRKGGAIFPKIDLKKAVEYNKKLVSKTHTSAQPESIILPGVFNTNGVDGTIRASALRQFGLLNEDKAKMEATQLGKSIATSPPNELEPELQKSCLSPKVFKQLFETFKGDTVNQAKLKQQATKLKVHPDSSEKCIRIFIKSLEYAGLAQIQGENVVLGSQAPNIKVDEAQTPNDEETSNDENDANTEVEENGKNKKDKMLLPPIQRKSPSGVQVNISLDSTMDTEKLEKLLKLLKNYGAI